ncbi:MAG: HAMP domain-containing sensor histidine kinase [Thermodesulfobacteriota bacterium]
MPHPASVPEHRSSRSQRRRAGAVPPPRAGRADPLLPDGAVLAVGEDGEILAHRSPLPPPFAAAGSLVGRRLAALAPPAVGTSLHRLLEETRAERAAGTSELTLSAGPEGTGQPLTLSLRVAPHPQRRGVCLVTVRNHSAHARRVEQLSQALEAVRAERDRWETAARSVAHDVRSSLAALNGFLNLALRSPAPLAPDVRESVSRAREVGTRLLGLTDLWSDSPRRGPARDELIDLGTFAARLFAALQVAYPEVGFSWCVDSGATMVRASPAALWSLLWGLLANAVKYRSGERSLHISLRARPREDEVELEVQDNGIGIPLGEEEAVFELGKRGSNAGRVEGAGLGLSGARFLARTWGGRVWAEPCPEGALLRVALPAEATGG